ncbi:hypothetical protein ACI2KR_07200 [Pseudomonas luteola]
MTASAASSCKDLQPSFIDKLADKICDQLDMSTPTIEQLKTAKNPLIYNNPEASSQGNCDIGLQMPGLPDFGLDVKGIDACGVLKAVTGEMVEKANNDMKKALDTTLEAVKGDKSIPSSIDMTDIITEQVGKAQR